MDSISECGSRWQWKILVGELHVRELELELEYRQSLCAAPLGRPDP